LAVQTPFTVSASATAPMLAPIEPNAADGEDNVYGVEDVVDVLDGVRSAPIPLRESVPPLPGLPTQPPTIDRRSSARSASAPAARPVVDAVGSERPTAQPVSESTRRFLAPLVGLDPATVRVHRGESAERLATAYHADAATFGDEVVLASDRDDETPDSVALLAHELTHVALRRGMSPPVVVDVRGSADRPALDEEHHARVVEARVARIAREQLLPAPPIAVGIPDDPWGGLPPPWEPLPDLALPGGQSPPPGPPLVASVSAAGIATPPLARTAATSAGPSSAPASAAPLSGGGSSTVPPGLAAHGRSLADSDADHESRAQRPTPPVEPDLDALAHQVYTILRHRLSMERRRGG
jgi:hypothetical protein